MSDIISKCKSVNISKSQDSTLTISITCLNFSDLFPESSLGEETTLFGQKVRCSGYNIPGIYKTIMFSNVEFKSTMASPNGFLWKSIPKAYALLLSFSGVGQIFRPEYEDPSIKMKYKITDDGWGSNGITARDVFNDIISGSCNIHSNFSPSCNYDILEYHLAAGTPLSSAIQGLFPLPGLIIYTLNDITYIDPPPTEDELTNGLAGVTICRQISSQSQTERYNYAVMGTMGHPSNITSPHVQNTGMYSGGDVIYNAFGGIYGITKMVVDEHNQYNFGK